MLRENLKSLRKSHGLKQVQVAKAVGISERQYQTLEYGNSNPQLDNLIALADLFAVTLDDLVGRVPPKA